MIDREYILKQIQAFKEIDCEAVILGCTDLPLLVKDSSDLDLIDSLDILADSTVKCCME